MTTTMPTRLHKVTPAFSPRTLKTLKTKVRKFQCDSESQSLLGSFLYGICVTALLIFCLQLVTAVFHVTLTSMECHQMSLVKPIYWIFAAKIGLIHSEYILEFPDIAAHVWQRGLPSPDATQRLYSDFSQWFVFTDCLSNKNKYPESAQMLCDKGVQNQCLLQTVTPAPPQNLRVRILEYLLQCAVVGTRRPLAFPFGWGWMSDRGLRTGGWSGRTPEPRLILKRDNRAKFNPVPTSAQWVARWILCAFLWHVAL